MHSYINPIIHSIPFSDVYAYDSALLTKVKSAEKNADESFTAFMTKMADEIGKEKWETVPSEFIIKSGYGSLKSKPSKKEDHHCSRRFRPALSLLKSWPPTNRPHQHHL